MIVRFPLSLTAHLWRKTCVLLLVLLLAHAGMHRPLVVLNHHSLMGPLCSVGAVSRPLPVHMLVCARVQLLVCADRQGHASMRHTSLVSVRRTRMNLLMN